MKIQNCSVFWFELFSLYKVYFFAFVLVPNLNRFVVFVLVFYFAYKNKYKLINKSNKTMFI